MAERKGGLKRRERKSELELAGSQPAPGATPDPTPAETTIEEAPAAAVQDESASLERIQAVAEGMVEDDPRKKMSGQVRHSVSERIRNIAYFARGGDLSAVIEEALDREAKRIEKAENKGEPFPQRPQRGLKGGRKVA